MRHQLKQMRTPLNEYFETLFDCHGVQFDMPVNNACKHSFGHSSE